MSTSFKNITDHLNQQPTVETTPSPSTTTHEVPEIKDNVAAVKNNFHCTPLSNEDMQELIDEALKEASI